MSHEQTSEAFLAHRRELVTFAARLVADRSRAEDIVQDAYMRFQQAAAKAPPLNVRGLLYRIVRNLSVDARRRRASEARLIAADTPAMQDAVDASPAADAGLIARQDVRKVAAAVAAMPERMSLALRLHRLEGAKLKEIAARLNVSVTVAHGLVAEAVRRCRDSLDGA